MTRDGYNTGWLWKKWAAEHAACVEAIRAGRINEAEAALERVELVSEQINIAGQMSIYDLIRDAEDELGTPSSDA